MNLQIGKPEKKVLSGGQRKRVNIALELVTDPVILFLDEPTSGLAADDTTALVNLLSDLTKKTGKTIVMTIHQPAKDEFEKFNLAFIMGYGGVPTYFGPSGDPAYRFFGAIVERDGPCKAMAERTGTHRVDNPRDMFDMLAVRERVVQEEMRQRDPNVPRGVARLAAARAWRAEFFQNQNPLFQKMYSGRRAVGTEPAAKGMPHRADVALVNQFSLLTSRYWKVKIRDRAGAAIMFLQAPIIGVMLAIVFGGQKPAIPFWCLGALNEIGQKGGTSTGGTSDWLQLHAADPGPRRRDVLRRRELRLVRYEQRGARDRERAGHLPARAHGEPLALQLRLLEVHPPVVHLHLPVRVPARHRLLLRWASRGAPRRSSSSSSRWWPSP